MRFSSIERGVIAPLERGLRDQVIAVPHRKLELVAEQNGRCRADLGAQTAEDAARIVQFPPPSRIRHGGDGNRLAGTDTGARAVANAAIGKELHLPPIGERGWLGDVPPEPRIARRGKRPYAELLGPGILLAMALHNQDIKPIRETMQSAGIRLNAIDPQDLADTLTSLPQFVKDNKLPYSILNDVSISADKARELISAAGLSQSEV